MQNERWIEIIIASVNVKKQMAHRHRLTHVFVYTTCTIHGNITKSVYDWIDSCAFFPFPYFYFHHRRVLKKSLSCKINDRLVLSVPGSLEVGGRCAKTHSTVHQKRAAIRFIASCEIRRISHFNFLMFDSIFCCSRNESINKIIWMPQYTLRVCTLALSLFHFFPFLSFFRHFSPFCFLLKQASEKNFTCIASSG